MLTFGIFTSRSEPSMLPSMSGLFRFGRFGILNLGISNIPLDDPMLRSTFGALRSMFGKSIAGAFMFGPLRLRSGDFNVGVLMFRSGAFKSKLGMLCEGILNFPLGKSAFMSGACRSRLGAVRSMVGVSIPENSKP